MFYYETINDLYKYIYYNLVKRTKIKVQLQNRILN